jgi:hypothetical protein
MNDNVQLCAGYNYFPAAFDPGIYELASKIVNDGRFYRTFVSYILKTLLDPTQLVHARSAIVNEIQSLAPQANMIKTVWCSLSLATEKYFDQKAIDYAWSDEERDQAKMEWYGLIAPGFIPGDYNRSLDISVLKAWKRHLIRLHDRDVGPMAACDMCTSKCMYSYEVKALDENWWLPFDKVRQRADAPKLAAHLALNLCANLGGMYDVDVAFCMTARTVQHQDSFEDAQYNFMEKVRVEIEKAVDQYKEASAERENKKAPPAKPKELIPSDGSLTREQIVEVIVRIGLTGAKWRQLCEETMLANKINAEEIELEIERRQKEVNCEP